MKQIRNNFGGFSIFYELLFLIIGCLFVVILSSIVLNINTPDTNSYIKELATFEFDVLKLDYFSWAVLKIGTLVFCLNATTIKITTLMVLILLSVREHIIYKANRMIFLLVSLFPVLPMISLSQFRVGIGLAVYFILLGKLKNNSTFKSLIVASFFHSSFLLIIICPLFIFFNDEFLELVKMTNFQPLINRVEHYFIDGYEYRGIFSGLELMLTMIMILYLAYVNKCYAVQAIGISLLISAIIDLSSWVIIRRLMELYLVLFGPYYFIVKCQMNPRTISIFLLFILYVMILINNVFNFFSHPSVRVFA